MRIQDHESAPIVQSEGNSESTMARINPTRAEYILENIKMYLDWVL